MQLGISMRQTVYQPTTCCRAPWQVRPIPFLGVDLSSYLLRAFLPRSFDDNARPQATAAVRGDGERKPAKTRHPSCVAGSRCPCHLLTHGVCASFATSTLASSVPSSSSIASATPRRSPLSPLACESLPACLRRVHSSFRLTCFGLHLHRFAQFAVLRGVCKSRRLLGA
jgi:hypothetical protein